MFQQQPDEADLKLRLKDVPTDLAEYRKWRFAAKAVILRAARNPVLVAHYLRELDDENVTWDQL